MAAEKALILYPASPLDAPHLVGWLRPVIEADPTADAFAVIAGATLYGVDRDGLDVLALLMRREGEELVIVAAAGHAPGLCLLDALLPQIEAASGARWVRIHTARRGMGRQLMRHGYRPAEVVYRKEIEHGRQVQQ